MRERRIIFLDVDGVLNCLPYCNRTGKELNPENIWRLKEIVDATGAEIILSSTWKQLWDDKEDVAWRQKELLVTALEEYGLSISGFTPNSKSWNRPREIHLYLLWHKIRHPREMVFFVSLDDDYGLEHYKPYHLEACLVSTKFFCREEKDGGLQDCHVKQAIEILKHRD